VVLEVGVQAYPKSFDLLKIWTKSLKIWVNPTSFDFKKWHPRFAEKHTKTCFGVHTKKVFMIFVGKFVSKSCTKSFSGKNLSHPHNFVCSYIYDEKTPPSRLPPF